MYLIEMESRTRGLVGTSFFTQLLPEGNDGKRRRKEDVSSWCQYPSFHNKIAFKQMARTGEKRENKMINKRTSSLKDSLPTSLAYSSSIFL